MSLRLDELSAAEARAVLGLPLAADREAIGRAFRAAAMRLHPDRSGGDAGRFHRAVEAYRRLRADIDDGESATRRSLRRFVAAWTAQPL